jgi:hypothetical protein
MKLAKVKIEYSSGTTIVDRVTLDSATGQVYLAPRVLGLLSKMESPSARRLSAWNTRATSCR